MPAWRTTTRFLAVFLFGGTVALTGCAGADGKDGKNGVDGTQGPAGPPGADGKDGTDGTNGTDGTDGTNGVDGTNGTDGLDGKDGKDYVSSKTFKNIDLKITAVANDGGALAVTFTAFDNGNPVTNLTMAPIRIMANQYLPKAKAYDNAIWSVDKFYEQGSTANADQRLVQGPLGTYTYTFLETIQEGITNDGVDAALPTQISMRIRGFETYNPVNAIYQVTGIPTTDGAMATEVSAPIGNIVETSACETCHGPRLGGVAHGGGYTKVEYCRNCHTRDDAAFVTDGLDFTTMIHQIHAAIDHTQGGTVNAGFDWSEVTYPQPVNNCNKCHKGADGQNWNTLPTAQACGSCHTAVNFTTGAGHTGGPQATNQNCQLCHSSDLIKGYHAGETKSPNNPQVPTGAANFEYKIDSVTADAAGNATVKFSILRDGAPINDLKTVFPPTGMSASSVGFLFAYSLPQDGINAPADWNNKGIAQGQPKSVTLQSVQNTANMTAPDANGVYTLTVNAAFPAGATMRAVGINGYFTQTSPAIGRHTPSVVKEVTGDSKRRAVVNFTGCLDCHESLELHGGSRTIGASTPAASVAVCTMCHNPNLSSSGNTFDMAKYLADITADPTKKNVDIELTRTRYGDDPMLWPEDSQNFKDLVHGIHGSGVRSDPYEHVRMRGGVAYSFDWSEVTFPADASNCAKCHVGNSYTIDAIPAAALASTKITDNGAITNPVTANAARNGTNLPNALDKVLAPVVAACNGCHNGKMIDAHMDQNGANFGLTRAQLAAAGPAQCAICHDTGSIADVKVRHPGLNP